MCESDLYPISKGVIVEGDLQHTQVAQLIAANKIFKEF